MDYFDLFTIVIILVASAVLIISSISAKASGSIVMPEKRQNVWLIVWVGFLVIVFLIPISKRITYGWTDLLPLWLCLFNIFRLAQRNKVTQGGVLHEGRFMNWKDIKAWSVTGDTLSLQIKGSLPKLLIPTKINMVVKESYRESLIELLTNRIGRSDLNI